MDDDFGGGGFDSGSNYDPGPSQDSYSSPASDPAPQAETRYEPCQVEPDRSTGNDQPSALCDTPTESHHYHHEGSGTTFDFRGDDNGTSTTADDNWLLNPLNPLSPLHGLSVVNRPEEEGIGSIRPSSLREPACPKTSHYNPVTSREDAPVRLFDYDRDGATTPIETQHTKPASWRGDWLRQTIGAGFGLVGLIRLGTELAKGIAGVPVDLGNVLEGVADVAATGIALRLTTPEEGARPHLAQRLLTGALGLPVFVGTAGMAVLETVAMGFGNEPVSPPTVGRLVEEVAGAIGSYRLIKRGTQGPQQ